jgi:hypothetical protein
MGEDRVHALALGYTGHRGYISRQGNGRQRTLADYDRMNELDRDMLSVGARATGAEHHKRAAAVEPGRHGVARISDRAGLAGELTSGIGAQLEQAGYR